MKIISTSRNGNIYQMRIEEATEIVKAYQRVKGFAGLLEAVHDMQDRATLDELPVIQKVALRRFKKDSQAMQALADQFEAELQAELKQLTSP
jgi:hypothetical protein